METLLQHQNYTFLQGGGEMGKLIRNYDWATTSLGTPEQWPLSLQISLANLLNSGFPMFLFWGDELICFYNDAFRPSLGTKGKHPAIGKKGKEVWLEIWDFIGPLIESVLQTGKPVWFEDQLVPFYRNGQIEDIYWTFSYSALLNDQGKRSGVLVTCVETTKSVIAHKAKEESEERLRFALDAGHLGSWELDLKTMVLDASKHCKLNFGQPVDEPFSYQTLQSCIHPEDIHQQNNAVMESIATGKEYDVEYRAIWPDKSVHWLNIRGRVKFSTNGTPERMIGVSIDITEQVNARNKINESEKNLRNMILQAPVAICIFRGKDHVIEIANEKMFEFWGKPLEAVMNKPLFEALPEAKSQGYEELLAGVLKTGEPFAASELPVTLPRNGVVQTVFINFSYEPLRETDGSITGIMAIAIDVTEQVTARQKIEEIVEQRTNELADANTALVTINTELKRSNSHLEEFAHAASHDLKEPIRKIHFFTTQLKKQFGEHLKETELRSFSRIENATQRMGTLIDDLLLYSHVSQQPHETEPLDLHAIIEGVLEDLDLDIQEKEAVIKIGKLPVVHGYRRQLQQLFQNVISNALKYSKLNVAPQIELTSTEEVLNGRTYHSILIKDNGIGFAQEYAEKIFQMFSRLHGKNEYSGTGVGLSIVKKVVENHKGLIQVESEIGKGSTFKIMLPF